MRRSKASGVSVPASSEDLAIDLRLEPKGKRILLVSGFKTAKDMWRFIEYIKVPMNLVPQAVGSTVIHKNLEVVVPNGTSFHAVGFGGNGKLMSQVFATALIAAGYVVADVEENDIVIREREEAPIPIIQCKGIHHNVRLPSEVAPQE